MKKKVIIEKTLGIKGDYQYKALRSGSYLQNNWHRNKLIAIEQLIKLFNPKTLLDLGAGSGNLELKFYKNIKKIVAVDYNDEAVSFLKNKLKEKSITNVKVYWQDLINVSKLKKFGKFDMIVMVDVAEHIKKNDFKKLVDTFPKLLNEKGKVVIITPNYQSFWPIIEKAMDVFTKMPNLEDMQHVNKLTKANLNKAFNKKYFKEFNYSTFNTVSWLLPSSSLSDLVCKLEIKTAASSGNLIRAVFELSR